MLMEIPGISSSMLECVEADDVVGARRLVIGIDDRDKKSIVAKRGDRDPPLFVAAMRGNVDMVEFLIKECHADTEERGRYVDPDRDCHLVTPLWLAAVLNKLEVLNSLINLGANINAASNTGSTPVLAACSKNVDVVKCLVKHGADVIKPNNYGRSCLMMAVQWSKEISQLLVENGAEVNTRDLSGNTALHLVVGSRFVSQTDKEDIVQLLIDHDSKPYINNKDGNDALTMATMTGQDSIFWKLMQKI